MTTWCKTEGCSNAAVGGTEWCEVCLTAHNDGVRMNTVPYYVRDVPVPKDDHIFDRLSAEIFREALMDWVGDQRGRHAVRVTPSGEEMTLLARFAKRAARTFLFTPESAVGNIPVVVDPDMPPDVVEIRQPGCVVTVVNLATKPSELDEKTANVIHVLNKCKNWDEVDDSVSYEEVRDLLVSLLAERHRKK